MEFFSVATILHMAFSSLLVLLLLLQNLLEINLLVSVFSCNLNAGLLANLTIMSPSNSKSYFFKKVMLSTKASGWPYGFIWRPFWLAISDNV